MNREMDGQLTISDETEFTSIAVAGPNQVITLPRVCLLMATSSAIPNGKISAAFGENSGPASFRQYVVTLLTNKNFLNLKILKHVGVILLS